MKKRILALLLALLTVLPMALSVFATEETEEEEKLDYVKAEWYNNEHRLSVMDLYATSPDGNMLLYVDPDSGEMGVKNVQTGDIYLSNPYDISLSSLLKREKPYALSQLNLTFKYLSTGTVKEFHSYNDCFEVGQAEIKSIPNGIEVTYLMGVQEQRLLVPNKIKKSDMDALLLEMKVGLRQDAIDALTKELGREPTEDEIVYRTDRLFYSYAFFILQQYVLYGPAGEYTTVYGDKKKITAAEAEAFKKEYPKTATEYIYIIANKGDGNIAVENHIKKYTSYTFEKLDAHYEAVKESVDDFSTEARPSFKIKATYEVTNQGLVATVDAGSLEYDKTQYLVTGISILPYFGAANAARTIQIAEKESVLVPDTGYTFIPDGSGALVRFEDLFAENRKQVKFENAMYGNDYAYYQISVKNAENMTMPVFGLSNSTTKTGFLAVIEDGDALSVVTSNHTTAYHSIYSTFNITPSDVYDLADSFSGGVSGSQKVDVSSKTSYSGLCKVNYITLIDNDVAREAGYASDEYYENSYVGMAKCYREYLQAKNIISDIPSTEINKDFTKLYLETFGSIKVEEQIATFPVTVNKELTTFNDIKEIHQELKTLGVGNPSFILKGYANGGLLSSYPTKMKWQKVLGGEKGLNDLLAYAEENNIDVIPDVEFSYSYGSSLFSTYNNKDHAVRTLDNRYTTKRTYYAATQTFERTGGVAVSSASFDVMYEKFYEAIEEYDIKYLSVRSLGSDLNSDFDEDEYYDREASKDNVVTMLKLLKGENGNKSFKLLIDSGNSYAIPYADAILSASLDSSRRSEMSESVPFFGMVYHGSIEFAGNAFNMEGDTEYAFLKAIENGAVLYFTIAKQNVELLKFEPDYNKYYSVSYDNLKETIKNTYVEFNGVMKDLQDKYIVNHGFVENATRTEDGGSVNKSQVVMVEYEGGIGFILNYSDYEINVTMPNGENATIASLGYQRYEK